MNTGNNVPDETANLQTGNDAGQLGKEPQVVRIKIKVSINSTLSF